MNQISWHKRCFVCNQPLCPPPGPGDIRACEQDREAAEIMAREAMESGDLESFMHPDWRPDPNDRPSEDGIISPPHPQVRIEHAPDANVEFDLPRRQG